MSTDSLNEGSRPARRCFSQSRTSPTGEFASWKIPSDTHGSSAPHLSNAGLEFPLAKKRLTRTIGPTGPSSSDLFRACPFPGSEPGDGFGPDCQAGLSCRVRRVGCKQCNDAYGLMTPFSTLSSAFPFSVHVQPGSTIPLPCQSQSAQEFP